MKKEIDFKGGIITYEDLFWVFEHSDDKLKELYLSEDLLQISYFSGDYLLDVGWYQDKFKILGIKNQDWENPLFSYSAKTLADLVFVINKGVEEIVETYSNIRN